MTRRQTPLSLDLALLARLRGHWRRRDHTPREMARLARILGSQGERLARLAALLDLGPKVSGSSYERGSVRDLAGYCPAEERRLHRMFRAYQRGGLRLVLCDWLHRARCTLRRQRARERGRREMDEMTRRCVEAVAVCGSKAAAALRLGISAQRLGCHLTRAREFMGAPVESLGVSP